MQAFLFWLLGLSIPVAVRTTILTDTIRAVENPFLTVYLYGSDLLLGGLLILMLIKSYAKLPIVPNWYLAIVSGGIWSIWISSYPLMSFLQVMRILVFMYVYLYAHNTSSDRWMWQGFVVGMGAQMIIVLLQFGTQSSLNLPLILEPVLDPSLSGVAKIDLFGNTLVRAAGTFPHPNILAFALLLVLWNIGWRYVPTRLGFIWKMLLGLGTLFAAQLDHYFLTNVQGMLLAGFVMLLLGRSYTLDSVSQYKMRDIFFAIATGGVLVLTFSKTALALATLGVGILLTMRLFPRMFHVEHFETLSKQELFQGILVVCILGLWSVIGLAFLPTAEYRLFYLQQASTQLIHSQGVGVGFGRFVSQLPLDLPFWRYQPVHSVPLLILAEVGVGILIALALYGVLRYTQKNE